jgi:hypothetical protein
MRTSKRYTNATFTHRPDREAGRHRPPRARPEPRICERCGAVYAKRRWTLSVPARADRLPFAASPKTTLCPACRLTVSGRFGGEVRVSGAFVSEHRAEIERLLRNEASRAAEDNPLGRITRVDRPAPDRLTVRTTTEHLAKRLGQALHKAFRGTVRYGFSHENKFAHVTWSRER